MTNPRRSTATLGQWIDMILSLPIDLARLREVPADLARILSLLERIYLMTSASADALADLNDAVSGEITAVADKVAAYERQVAGLLDQLQASDAQKAQLDTDLAGEIRKTAARVRTIVTESPATPDPGTDPGGDGTGTTDPGTDPGTVDPGTDGGTVDPVVVDDGTTTDPGTVDDGSTVTVDDGTVRDV